MINIINVVLSHKVQIEGTLEGLKIITPKDYVVKHESNRLSIDPPPNMNNNVNFGNMTIGCNATVVCNNYSYNSGTKTEEPIEHIEHMINGDIMI